jgi:hypothetical protein
MAEKETTPRNKAGRTAFGQKVYNAAKKSGKLTKGGEPTAAALRAANKALMMKTSAAARKAKKKAAVKKAPAKKAPVRKAKKKATRK